METKKCKYCMTDIPKGAKICPNCKKRQGGILKWLLIILAVLIIFGMIGDKSGSKDDTAAVSQESSVTTAQPETGADTAEAQQPETKQQEKAVISYIPYSVTELETDLEENALSASDKYKGQYVELTGRLGTIDSDGKYISIKDPTNEWDFIGVQCYIKSDAQLNTIKTLKKDCSIIVKGKIRDVGEVIGYSLDMDEIASAE